MLVPCFQQKTGGMGRIGGLRRTHGLLLLILAIAGAYPDWDGVNVTVSWDSLSGTSEDGSAEIQIMQPEPGQLIIPEGEDEFASFNVEFEFRVGSQGDETMGSKFRPLRSVAIHVSMPPTFRPGFSQALLTKRT
jgi:hypothetical protein